MAININNLNNTNQVKQQVQTKQQVSENANASQQVKLSPRDSVSITAQAKQMTELQKKAAESPVLNLSLIHI